MKIAQRLGLIWLLLLHPLLCLSRSLRSVPPSTRGAFLLYEFDIKDPAAFKPLAAEIRASLKDYKGEFVMREKVESLFGGAPSNLSVISFPGVADARTWLASPTYTKLKADLDKAASVRSYLVEKLD